MKILIFNWRDPEHPAAGGAEKYLFEIARRFIGMGHRVVWLTAGFRGAPPQATLDGIQIVRVGNRFTVYAMLPLAFVRRFRDTCDAIIDAENGIPFFAPLFTRRPTICLMFHVHQRVFEKHLPFPISTLFKFIERSVMPAAYRKSRYVAISRDTKSEMSGLGIEPDSIDLAVSGIDPALAPGEKSDRPTILYLGRLKAYKRVDLLLKAFAKIKSSIPDVQLIVAGAGDRAAALAELATELAIGEDVRFEGSVTDERKRDLMSSAWVFAMPSEMEGWGLTIIEANACGTPCVGYNVPGVGEAIEDGVTGALVPDGDSLAPAIIRILSDTKERNRLSSSALRYAATFSWDETAVTVEALLTREVRRSMEKTSHDGR